MNTSTHDPLLLIMHLNTNTIRKIHESEKKRIGKPLWDKCDKTDYNNMLSSYLSTDVQPESAELAIEYFQSSIQKTTDALVPVSNPKVKSAPWNENIAARYTECKTADTHWRDAGKPDPPHPLFKIRKNAAKLLRSAQRIQRAIIRENNIITLNNASEDNSNLFYAIVKKQRQSKSNVTKELLFEGQLH